MKLDAVVDFKDLLFQQLFHQYFGIDFLNVTQAAKKKKDIFSFLSLSFFFILSG